MIFIPPNKCQFDRLEKLEIRKKLLTSSFKFCLSTKIISEPPPPYNSNKENCSKIEVKVNY